MAPEGHDTDNADIAPLEAAVKEYQRIFGETPPVFGVAYDTDEDELAAIEQALRTGEPIKDRTPPGCVS